MAEPKTPSPQLDQRSSERLPIALPLMFLFEGSAEGKTLHGRSATTDLSGRGLQFLIPWQIPAQTRCQITVDLPHAGTRVQFVGSVSWCQAVQAAGDRYEVGVAIEPADGQDDGFESYCHFIASQLLARALRGDSPL